jgi:RNA polymerase sigma factor (sigma-70 family)
MKNGTTAQTPWAARVGLLAGTDGQDDRQLLEQFVKAHDGAAFEVLVRRHGPMVLGVCRRILGNAADAEDAFQATFLVLVRKASSLSKPELLANWLYGVAFRTAQKAKAQICRRTLQERQAMTRTQVEPEADEGLGPELKMLDEELQQLPAKYRIPLVLCYLEGLTNEEAARRLGWPPGSMSYRLARGRELLRERLSQRQRAVLPAPLFGLMLVRATAPEKVPSSLVQATVKAALGGTEGAGAISTKVAALVEAGLLGMAGRKIGSFIIVIVALAALTAAVVASAATLSSGRRSDPPATTTPTPEQSVPPGSCH